MSELTRDFLLFVPMAIYVLGLIAAWRNVREHRKLAEARRKEAAAWREAYNSLEIEALGKERYMARMYLATGGRSVEDVESIFSAIDRAEGKEELN